MKWQTVGILTGGKNQFGVLQNSTTFTVGSSEITGTNCVLQSKSITVSTLPYAQAL